MMLCAVIEMLYFPLKKVEEEEEAAEVLPPIELLLKLIAFVDMCINTG